MYLKSISMHGFKSFADKTELLINNGIIGVVGPNGSGKSNIVDAIKWVLGEQSVKALRGTNSMSDVIFTGSKTREPHSRATVSLTFDNKDHYLNSEFEELEIKRVLYKTGENEYYINNSKVRLKDIVDLFTDSGAGKESFNIIGQGEISDIINNKPEERRSIFEEAAGVLKYKKRKEQSLSKLEKTSENLERIKLLINELELQVLPLKEQSEVALKYQGLKEELENIEIALITKDIHDLNEEHSSITSNLLILEKEIEEIDSTNNKDTSKVESLKLKEIKIDETLNKLNEKLLNITNELSELTTRKQVNLERKKYSVDDVKLENNIISLKEQELSNKKIISGIKKDIEEVTNSLDKLSEKKSILENEYNLISEKKVSLQRSIEDNNKNILDFQNKINIIENNLLNDNSVPFSVKSVLDNPRLNGIHNILGKLIDTDREYSLAIDTALGYMSNVIVVDNESNAKEAINYLKNNKLGRATFFPINIIKPKGIEESLLERLTNINGYIDIASNLVSFDSKYRNIITNQLGNVIVAKDLDSVNLIGKIIDYKYRIVSLDGEILHAGGSITGGILKNNNSTINQKNELEHLNKELNKENVLLEENLNKLQSLKEEYNIIENNIFYNNKEVINLNEQINSKSISLKEYELNWENLKEEINGTQDIKSNKLDSEITNIMEEYSNKEIEKENIIKDLNNLRNEKSSLVDEINQLEKNYKDFNSEYNKKQNILKDYEIKLSRIEVKLDNLLITLNEQYNMTYERAKDEYILELDENVARNKVNSLKYEIKNLGEINLGSISEYERVNKRYTFLSEQKSDLELSINNLMNIISEMDLIMITKFKETFEQISKEFETVFKKMFKGGKGILKYTNPDDILTTGIDIIAEPPGKKLNSIALLSGGEKTLTAIALLFSILNVKPVPFVILDEVEAALDDPNVDMFGNYLLEKKQNSQFVLITHKKRTMEYVDVLYGITMQESGVSKLVSVKLDKL